MIPFYTELKNLRDRQEIELSEIAKRTKINLAYLEAMEEGDFTFLPNVYVRLFLKAYSLEIGADMKDVLNQLEIHLANLDDLAPLQDKTEIDESLPEKGEEKETDEIEESAGQPFQVRAPAIKVAILLAVVFFAVYVIRQIATEESSTSQAAAIASEDAIPNERITDRFLDMNYISLKRTQELLLASPFSFTLSSKAPVWYEFSIDFMEPVSKTLLAGSDVVMDFKSYFHLRLDRGSDVSLKINDSVVIIDSIAHPVDIVYQADSGTLTITSYSPR